MVAGRPTSRRTESSSKESRRPDCCSPGGCPFACRGDRAKRLRHLSLQGLRILDRLRPRRASNVPKVCHRNGHCFRRFSKGGIMKNLVESFWWIVRCQALFFLWIDLATGCYDWIPIWIRHPACLVAIIGWIACAMAALVAVSPPPPYPGCQR